MKLDNSPLCEARYCVFVGLFHFPGTVSLVTASWFAGIPAWHRAVLDLRSKRHASGANWFASLAAAGDMQAALEVGACDCGNWSPSRIGHRRNIKRLEREVVSHVESQRMVVGYA